MCVLQYGLIQGYAYYLVYGLSMMTVGYVTDKYRLNRVYVVAIGSILTGVALVIEVQSLRCLASACTPNDSAVPKASCLGHIRHMGAAAVSRCSEHDLPGTNHAAGAKHDAACMVQGCATSFTMFLGGIVLSALASSVIQNIPFTILSDMLPPEQLGCGMLDPTSVPGRLNLHVLHVSPVCLQTTHPRAAFT